MNFSFFGKKEKQVEDCPEANGQGVLMLKNILIGEKSVSKEEAIKMAGQLLVDGGYVMPEYIEAMIEREKMLTTYIGEGIAIPHGVGASRDKIIKTGISIIQFPEGVSFGDDQTAYLVVGIAGKDKEHMRILTNLAGFIQDADKVKELFITKDSAKIYNALISTL